jgi:hypothetical protein
VAQLLDTTDTATNSFHKGPAYRCASVATMSLTNCRFYEEKYPEIDSFVMVNVKQVRIQRRVQKIAGKILLTIPPRLQRWVRT